MPGEVPPTLAGPFWSLLQRLTPLPKSWASALRLAFFKVRSLAQGCTGQSRAHPFPMPQQNRSNKAVKARTLTLLEELSQGSFLSFLWSLIADAEAIPGEPRKEKDATDRSGVQRSPNSQRPRVSSLALDVLVLCHLSPQMPALGSCGYNMQAMLCAFQVTHGLSLLGCAGSLPSFWILLLPLCASWRNGG